MDSTPKSKRRKRPINGLSPELMDAMEREYKDWQGRVRSEDPTLPPVLSDDEWYQFESGRLPVATVTRIRNMIFSDLVSRGFKEAEVCQRLLLSHKTYLKIVWKCFGVTDPKLVRAHSYARTLDRLNDLRAQRRRMKAMAENRKGDHDFTNAERGVYIQLIKIENELEASLRKMHAADAPEQIEVKETKQYSVVLLPVQLSQEPVRTVIDISQPPPPLIESRLDNGDQ